MITLAELGKKINAELKGDGAQTIQGVRDLEQITVHDKNAKPANGFIYFIENKKNLNAHPESRACSAVLTTEELKDNFQNALVVPAARARIAFIELLKHFEKIPAPFRAEKNAAFIAPSAKVDPSAIIMPGAVIMDSAEIGADCVIHPNAVIEPNVKLGARTIIHPNVVIKYNCVLGTDCIIHSCTVIGADGFGFYDKDGVRYKIPQIGNVVIGNFVETGASVTIDRAAIESTVIGDYTKLDDQVHIGHNCQVGKYVYIAGNTVLAGSVILEDNVIMGGQSALPSRVRIGKGTVIMGFSGVNQDTEPGGIYFGVPARPAREMHKINGSLEYLPELLKRVRAIEEKLEGK